MDAETYLYFGAFFLISGYLLVTQFALGVELGCLEALTVNVPDALLICAVRGSAFMAPGAIFFVVGLGMFIYGIISRIELFFKESKKRK